MKDLVLKYIMDNHSEYCKMADDIFDNPEIGFTEFFASNLLCDKLTKLGYKVEQGIFGTETDFRAKYRNGNGGIRIGLLCEYDALPMGHACGHHMQGPIMILAAEAIKHTLKDIDYDIIIYGTPAEEGFQGKLKMQNHGAFDDVDLTLMTHASPYTTVDIKSLTGAKYSFTLTGVAAHESLTPELTRSATDAMMLAFNGLEFLRGHVKEDVKFNAQINACNGMEGFKHGNALAKCTVALRTYHSEDVPELESRMIDVFKGAALMTGTKVEYEKLSHTMGKLPNLTLNRIIMDNAAELKMPNILKYRERTGSTDYAEVSHQVASAVSRYVLVPPHATSHSQEFLDCGKGEPAIKGLIMGCELIATTVYDIITNPSLAEEVITEFKQNKEEYLKKTQKAI